MIPVEKAVCNVSLGEPVAKSRTPICSVKISFITFHERSKDKLNRKKTIFWQVIAGKKKINILWDGREDVSGFQIQYAQNKAFTKKAKIYNAGKTAEKIVIKGLKKQYTIITHLLVLHSSIFHHSVHRYI